MKILIANSKEWFIPDEYLKNNHEILIVKEKTIFSYEMVKRFKPDFIFLPHWSWRVPDNIHKNFLCILFHTAPLPFGRGGSPIQNLILEGYEKSPVCALKMIEDMDAGPIYLTKELDLRNSLSKILEDLNIIVNDLIFELIRDLPEPRKQLGDVFNFKRRNFKDNRIPNNVSLDSFYDRIRMLDDDSYPNSYIEYGDFFIEFYNVDLIDGQLVCKAIIKKKNS